VGFDSPIPKSLDIISLATILFSSYMKTFDRQKALEELFSNLMHFKRSLHGMQVTCPGGGTITGSQVALLFTISRLQPTTVRKLATALLMTPGAVSQALDGFDTHQLITRHQDDNDRRIVHIILSDTGKKAVTHLHSRRYELIKAAAADVSDEDLAATLRVQSILIKSIEKLNEVKLTDKKG